MEIEIFDICENRFNKEKEIILKSRHFYNLIEQSHNTGQYTTLLVD